jgi:hypothetical protein
MLKRWLGNVWAFLAWALVCGLALIVLIQAASLYQVFIRVTLLVNRWSNTLWLNLYYMTAGLLWLGFVILMEHLLMGSESRAGLLLPRTLFCVGIELLVIGLLQMGLQAYLPLSWFGIGLALLEMLAGGGLIWAARRKPRKVKPQA